MSDSKIDKDKLLKYGAIALGGACAIGLVYYLISSDDSSSSGSQKKAAPTPTAARAAPKSLKFYARLDNRFDNINVCSGPELKDCFITSDANNRKIKNLRPGAQLIQFNDQKCAGWPFKKILEEVAKADTPITARFLQHPQLEEQWNRAEEMKLEANKISEENNKSLAETKKPVDPEWKNKALDLYSRAIDLHPMRKEYYGNRILVHFYLKKYDDAIADCEKFAPLDPLEQWQRGMHLRGLSYHYKQDTAKALEWFQKVVACDEESKMAQKAKARIAKLAPQFPERREIEN